MMRQKNQVVLNLGTGGTGEARNAAAQETEAGAAKACLEHLAAGGPPMERVVERNNLRRALEQVQRNKGAPGVDGMSVGKLASHLKEHWPAIRAQLLAGAYQPQPVRRVEIPKASGGHTCARDSDAACIMHLVQFGLGDRMAMREELATQSRSLRSVASVIVMTYGRPGFLFCAVMRPPLIQ
jgi:hypothetical protein